MLNVLLYINLSVLTIDSGSFNFIWFISILYITSSLPEVETFINVLLVELLSFSSIVLDLGIKMIL